MKTQATNSTLVHCSIYMEEWKNDDDDKETINSDVLIVGARCDILETQNIILSFTCPSLLLAVPLIQFGHFQSCFLLNNTTFSHAPNLHVALYNAGMLGAGQRSLSQGLIFSYERCFHLLLWKQLALWRSG